MSAIDGFAIESKPVAHLGVGAIDQLPGVIRATAAGQVVVMTDDALASTPAIATVTDGVDDARGALIEPLSCAVHGLRRMGPVIGKVDPWR